MACRPLDRFAPAPQLMMVVALMPNCYTCLVMTQIWKFRKSLYNKTCACETPMPPAATKSNMAKISKSYILTLPNPQGHVMSEECEQPLDELTVQVWWLYHQSNFKYCTLFESGTELRTDRQTNRQTDDPITRCPWADLSGRGHKKHIWYNKSHSMNQASMCTL